MTSTGKPAQGAPQERDPAAPPPDTAPESPTPPDAEPAAGEAPTADAPVGEAPVGEAPVAEAPSAEAPVAEAPAAAAPSTRRPPSRPPARRGWLIPLALGVTAVLLLTLLAVIEANDDSAGSPPAAANPPARAQEVSAPLANRRRAGFELASGADSVTVRGADLGNTLYRVTTAAGSGLTPEVADTNGLVRLNLAVNGAGPGSAVTIELNSTVQWRLRLAGGGQSEVVDMRRGRLAALELTAGAGKRSLALPKPTGTVPVTMRGGSAEVTLSAPLGVPARVRVGDGGAGTVTVDGAERRNVAAGTVLDSAGWAKARDRYDFRATAGVGVITILHS